MKLAMLCMALFLLTACGSASQASSKTSSADTASSKTVSSQAAAAELAPAAAVTPAVSATVTSAPSATVTPAPSATATSAPSLTPQSPITFAVIGDDGNHSEGEKAVADIVNGWKPDFVINTGDAYYSQSGGYSTDKYDRSVGTYYCDFLKDVTTTGTDCPQGNADRNRFFPTLGKHDYSDAGVDNYLKYFDLPGKDFTNTSGNERYYDFMWGPVHFFSLDSNSVEPDGVTPDSKQGQWLQTQLAKSTSAWNIVFFHHPPYTSGSSHGPDKTMQWPFQDWGVTAVLNGHEHLYERLQVNGVVYFVNGLGGGARYPFKATPVPGSQARVDNNWGAQKVTATDKEITFDFYTVDDQLADSYTISK